MAPRRPPGANPVLEDRLGRIAADLAGVRERTHRLIAPLSEEALHAQHSPLMSPIAWDLGHIAEFEELWLVRKLGEAAAESELADVYDAARTPRSRRGALDLPPEAALSARLEEVRRASLERLPGLDPESDNPLLQDGFVYEMVRRHEAQHQETILQTIVLMTSEDYRPPERRPHPTPDRAATAEMIHVPAGAFDMGAGPNGFAYDNERPRVRLDLPAFEIGRYPTTNGEYVEFIAAGGYAEPAFWSEVGWAWQGDAGLFAPEYWVPDGAAGAAVHPREAAELTHAQGSGGWARRTSLGLEPLRADDPVVNICFHEAEAYARFRGARLPTEAEWEKAAAWDPDTGATLPLPWGREPFSSDRANLDQLSFGVAPAGAYPSGRSPIGCEQMLGDVWEWTSSFFRAYAGFRAFPYAEYSEVFFGEESRVLRGGSWATLPCVARNSFRNWDYPIRRQIFAGVRLARDA